MNQKEYGSEMVGLECGPSSIEQIQRAISILEEAGLSADAIKQIKIVAEDDQGILGL